MQSVPSLSMPWPATVLNATNRALAAEVDAAARKIAGQRQACTEAREVLAAVRTHAQQTRRMIAEAEAQLHSKREEAAATLSAAKRLRVENERARREVQQQEADLVRLRSEALRAGEAIAATHEQLAAAVEVTALLERDAKDALEDRLAREQHGQALEQTMSRLSATVWARLERLNAEVHSRQAELARARGERDRHLQELGAVQVLMREAVLDQQDSVRALENVMAESAAADQAILANSHAMQALKEEGAAQAGRRAQLGGQLASLQTAAVGLKKEAGARRAAYDRLLGKVRDTVERIRLQAGDSAAARRERAAQRQACATLRTALSHRETLAEEALGRVRHHEEYAAQLQQLVRAAEAEAASAVAPSPESLLATIRALESQFARVEDRLGRVQVRVAQATQDLVAEGRRCEAVQDAVVRRQGEGAALAAEQAACAAARRDVGERLRRLDEETARRQALLPELRAASLAQFEERRRACEAAVAALREQLQTASDTGRRLLQANTSLRIHARAARDGLSQRQRALAEEGERGVLLTAEVPSLEKDLAALDSRRESLLTEYERALVTYEALRAAADGQVGAIAEAAGAGELLRARAAVEMARIEADMQSALVELHLHQAALREEGEELRRHSRRRDLLRSRYEELMRAMSRAVAAPLAAGEAEEAAAGAAAVMPSLAPMEEGAAPEALHARLLLHRSYARERLMERGNHLDLRLVALERETATLRGMLAALQDNRTTAAGAAAAICGKQDGGHADPHEAGDAAATQQRRAGEAAQAHLMRAELDVHNAALAAMQEQSELSRVQLRAVRKELQELQSIEKQKRVQAQKMQDRVQRERQKRVREGCQRLKSTGLNRKSQ